MWNFQREMWHFTGYPLTLRIYPWNEVGPPLAWWWHDLRARRHTWLRATSYPNRWMVSKGKSMENPSINGWFRGTPTYGTPHVRTNGNPSWATCEGLLGRSFLKQIRMARKTQGIRGSQVKCFRSESQRGPRQGNPNVCFSKLYWIMATSRKVNVGYSSFWHSFSSVWSSKAEHQRKLVSVALKLAHGPCTCGSTKGLAPFVMVGLI